MKNLKKITREGMRSIQGSGTTVCPAKYYLKCESIYVCDPEQGIYDCLCSCVPIGS
ncbi:bacteriocin-like protein [Chryseobacterium angstadtii]|uniref:bacteriocin-like protein n=1 Tax=Chryseobacterium angstadtii TaxID=558151 RepID=UPI000A5D1904